MGTRHTLKMGGRNPFDALPEELWKHIFCRVPHVTRLQSRCVSVQWKRVLLELEAVKPARSQRCLALERLGEEDEEGVLEWSILDTFSGKKTKVNLSWPPGWTPGLHGGIRGGGPCGLVALWDCASNLYWVGSPVHDKWEKVPEPSACKHLTFRRRGFHLVGDKNSGFYKIVQFQLNEFRQAKSPSWVIQVYSSRCRTWRTEEKTADLAVFSHLYHSCVSDNKVYFLGSVRPPPQLETIYVMGMPLPEPCPLVIWAFDMDTGAWNEIRPPAQVLDGDYVDVLGHDLVPYWSSLRLQVIGHSDFKISVVSDYQRGNYHGPRRICRFGLDPYPNWVLEEEVGLREFVKSQTDCWGLSFLAYNGYEVAEDDYPEYALLDVRRVIIILSFNNEQQKWQELVIHSPLYENGELPVTPFFPCCSEFGGHLKCLQPPNRGCHDRRSLGV